MKFKNLENRLNKIINDKTYPGIIVQIHKNKEIVYSNTFGYNDIEQRTRYQDNTKFLIASLTKPITVYAFMLLVDQGLVSVDEPVSKYLPEYEKMTYVNKAQQIVSSTKPMLIKHLLTMTSGLDYAIGLDNIAKQSKKLMKEWHSTDMSLRELVKRTAKIPLRFNPGQDYLYGPSLDVLGAIIEVVTNLRFEEFLQINVFDKIKMSNTTFYYDKNDDKAMVYVRGDYHKNLVPDPEFKFSLQKLNSMQYGFLGGANLISTIQDFMRFVDVLVDGININNQRLISIESLNEIKKNRSIDSAIKLCSNFNDDYGFGYGIRVRIKNQLSPITNVGEYGWYGALGSVWLTDETLKITACAFTSVVPGRNRIIIEEFMMGLYEDLKNNDI